MDTGTPPVEIAAPSEDAARFKIPSYVKTRPRCPPHAPDEIVVCAEDPEQFRLRPLPDKFGPAEEGLPRTRNDLNERTSVGVEVEREGIGGQISNRVMVRGRIKF